MKKRCIAVVLIWVMITCFGLYIHSVAFADPFTASQIGAVAGAVFNSWGLNFTMAAGSTQQNANGFLTSQVQNYVNSQGGSIGELFAGDLAVDVAGNLVVGQQIYNSLVDFANWLIPQYNLGAQNVLMGVMFEDQFMDAVKGFNAPDVTGFSWVWDNSTGIWLGHWAGPGYVGADYGNIPADYEMREQYYYWANGAMYSRTTFVYNAQTRIGQSNALLKTVIEQNTGKHLRNVYGNAADFVEPTVLNPDKAWSGTIGGYSEPDTNLDQLLGDINQAVADNNLVVDGEVIDVPVPPGPVPTWTPVDDVIDGINQTGEILEGIGNDIGDISGHLDDMGDQIDTIGETLEGVQEGIQTQTGVISGAIDQATQDVVDAIGEQTATLDQTLTDTAESVQDIAEALQPGQITPRQFDLRRLFPFCIPFDIHNLLQKFDAEPVAPHVQLPFVIQSIGFSYTFDLDFSAFDSVAAVMRTVEFIVFSIGLAWATSKVIKW